MEVKKPYAVVQYNKFIKDVDRADQYLSYYSHLKKTVRWSKRAGTIAANLCVFQHFFVYMTLNTNRLKYKNFLHEVRRSWILEVQN